MTARVRIQTSYLDKVYRVSKFTKTIDRATKALKAFHKKNPFDAIAFTGTSGAALAYPLSYKLGIPLICIRKSVADNHSGMRLEGCVSAKRYIIVDDCIESGSTVRKIQKFVKKELEKAQLIGILLYSHSDSYWDDDVPIIKM